MLDRLGRRWSMVVCAIPFLVGSVLFVVANAIENEIPIYFGRVLTGEQLLYSTRVDESLIA